MLMTILQQTPDGGDISDTGVPLIEVPAGLARDPNLSVWARWAWIALRAESLYPSGVGWRDALASQAEVSVMVVDRWVDELARAGLVSRNWETGSVRLEAAR